MAPANGFEKRKLSIGTCPLCNKEIGELEEYRQCDGERAFMRVQQSRLNKLRDTERTNLIYTSSRMKAKKGLHGWIYGINRIFKNKKGIVYKQYASDFSGNQELIKVIRSSCGSY